LRTPTLRTPAALALALLLAGSLAAPVARAGIILSELCDPRDNYTTDRFIEIYNSGPNPVDLTSWSVVAIANNVDVCTWPLSGVIAPNQALVCGGPTTVTGFTVNFQSAVWATTAGYMNWNGRVGDGAKLKNAGGTITDIVVATGVLFENSDLVRNSNITDPNPVYTPSEWTSTPVILATDASPGTHNGSAPPPAGPMIANIVTIPSSPAAGDGVHVQATVVDTLGPVTSVSLDWGTASNSLTTTIGMSAELDSLYQTDTPIPGQIAGTTVYYRLTATGASGTRQTSTANYVIPGTAGAPTILAVGEMSDSTLLVFFSEPVEPVTAGTSAYYTVGALTAVAAVRDPAHTSQVLITVRGIAAGARTLTVTGVQDLDGNPTSNATCNFNYVDVSIPAGYYNGTAGLQGSALLVALHNIIKNHLAQTYAYAYTAFMTTDVRPDGKVWDPYSDVPGGTPPYEYSFGQTTDSGPEGAGYNREHTWPQSWFNGNAPMHDDLWILYPTDSHVNNLRANYPYGKVGTPTTTSLNGSKLGPSVTPGYSGTVFEPIDWFKGDLARSAFYVSTRYFNEDQGWTGSVSTSGANLLPWAANQYVLWSQNDPPSWKERMRNGAIYVIQHNRNPFVDHPEFVGLIWDSTNVTAVGDGPSRAALTLGPGTPNPFQGRTTIAYSLPERAGVSLAIFDLAGRRVKTLASGVQEPGAHQAEWDGRDEAGASVGAGLYFCRLTAGTESVTRRLVRVD